MAEQQILRLGCNGLMTDPGPFAGVPDGAMVEAQNVTFQQQMAARMLFASKEEKDAVGRAISRALGDAMATAAPEAPPAT